MRLYRDVLGTLYFDDNCTNALFNNDANTLDVYSSRYHNRFLAFCIIFGFTVIDFAIKTIKNDRITLSTTKLAQHSCIIIRMRVSIGLLSSNSKRSHQFDDSEESSEYPSSSSSSDSLTIAFNAFCSEITF